MSARITEALGALDEHLRDVLDDGFVEGLGETELVRVLQVAGQIGRRVDAAIAAVTDAVQVADGGPRPERMTTRLGCRSVNELLQRTTLCDARAAAGFERAARVVHREVAVTTGAPLPARYPGLREAFVGGWMSVEGLLHATAPLDAAARRVSADDLAAADAQLASAASGRTLDDEHVEGGDDGREDAAVPPLSAEDLRYLAKVVVAYLDQDGAEPEADAAAVARSFHIGVVKDGVVAVRGNVLPEVAAQFRMLASAIENPRGRGVRFVPDTDSDSDSDSDSGFASVASSETDRLGVARSAAPEGGDASEAGTGDAAFLPPPPPDPRSPAQRRHDALAAMLTLAAGAADAPTLGGAAPTLVVAVRAEDYVSGQGPAFVDGLDEPVSLAVARRVACCGSVQRVIFDRAGRIVGISTSARAFDAHQRRALTVRDGGCLIPGCHVPAAWCELHHVEEHSRGGPTHTDNGVLLCGHHHRTIDAGPWEIRMIDGVPHVRGPSWWDPQRRWRRAVSHLIPPLPARRATVPQRALTA